MSIYDKPVWKLMYDMVDNLGLEKGDTVSKDQVLAWFAEHYPKIKASTISAHLIRQSTNAPGRVHHHAKPGDDDLFFQIDGSHFRLYDPENDPPPIYKEWKPPRKPVSALRTKPFLDEILDAVLRERVSRLGSAPLDAIIREAGVVLEDRLRAAGRVDSTEHGAGLVDAVLGSEKGALVFSPHVGEQQGVWMLYRGAMQFVRNPPMHRLVEYPEGVARLFIRLIDTLLRLLSELEPRQRGEITADDVRRMLTRMPIPRGQQALYRALYQVGEQGLSGAELAAATGRSKSELAGVLGALGRRINRTDGLEGKGGIEVVLQVSATDDGDWHYQMRAILREALKAERIVQEE